MCAVPASKGVVKCSILPPRHETDYDPRKFRLDGKLALIAGGTRGIGLAITHREIRGCQLPPGGPEIGVLAAALLWHIARMARVCYSDAWRVHDQGRRGAGTNDEHLSPASARPGRHAPSLTALASQLGRRGKRLQALSGKRPPWNPYRKFSRRCCQHTSVGEPSLSLCVKLTTTVY